MFLTDKLFVVLFFFKKSGSGSSKKVHHVLSFDYNTEKKRIKVNNIII